jgi:putative ABC transport system substrate-binding protein
VRRRELLLALGLLAPWRVEAQSPGAVPRIGLLDAGSPAARALLWEAFRQGMRHLGYVEGRTVIFEGRFADGKPDRLPALAAELVRLKVDVIVTAGGSAAEEARQATATIPIVQASGEPTIGDRVASLARPGGNVTGLSTLTVEFSAKRLELARELVPRAVRFAIFWAGPVPALFGRPRRRPGRSACVFTRSASRVRRTSTPPSRRSRGSIPRCSSWRPAPCSSGSAGAWLRWP